MPVPARSFGCSWKPLTRHDLPELADLVAAIEYLDDTLERHSLADLEGSFDDPDADTAHNTVLVRHNGTAVAYGWNNCCAPDDPQRRVFLVGGTHPSWRNRGVGSVLLAWQVERAREWYAATYRGGFSPLELVAVSDQRNGSENRLLQQAGFVAQHWFHDLHQFFDPEAPVLHVAATPGVEIVDWQPARSEQVRLTHNACFADRPGAHPVTAQEWIESLQTPSVRLDLSWIALAGDEVVGYAINSVPESDDGIGWTDRLGALVKWRNRGLLSALLATSLNSFRAVGLQGAGIGVDSDSASGVRPYEALGYAVAETLVWYVHRERDGYSGSRNSPVDQNGNLDERSLQVGHHQA